MKDHGLPRRGAVPKDAQGHTVELKAYWQGWCLDQLHRRYKGVCAYTSLHIPRVTGARSVDHYVAKSSAIEHAYRWSNYRLACSKMNGRKGTFDDLLDPFTLALETFHLVLLTGEIFPNPALPKDLREQAQKTIDRLGIDEGDCCLDRLEYYEAYRTKSIDEAFLKKRCPFVWYEVHRQKLTV